MAAAIDDDQLFGTYRIRMRPSCAADETPASDSDTSSSPDHASGKTSLRGAESQHDVVMSSSLPSGATSVSRRSTISSRGESSGAKMMPIRSVLPVSGPVARLALQVRDAACSLDRLVSVMRQFGINRARTLELRASVWPSVMSSSADAPPFCSAVSNEGLRSLQGWLRGDALGAYIQLVARASEGTCVALDDCHTDYMPGNVYGASEDVCLCMTERLDGRHLTRTIFGPIHFPGHWGCSIIAPSSEEDPAQHRTVRLLDPLGKSRAEHKSRRAVASLQGNWLRQQFSLAGRPALSFDIASNPADLSCQNDDKSCGFFSAAYPYYHVLHGRLPTTADFDGDDHRALRLVMLDTLVTGLVRRPLPVGSEEMTAVELEDLPMIENSHWQDVRQALRVIRAERDASDATRRPVEIVVLD